MRVPDSGTFRMPTTLQFQETLVTLKSRGRCRRKFHLKAKDRGAFSCLEACPCHPLLTVIQVLIMALRYVASGEAITSAVFRAEVATSAEATDSAGASAVVSVAEEDTAVGKVDWPTTSSIIEMICVSIATNLVESHRGKVVRP